MSELILHQYASSPFSERVRLTLGLKGLSWRSVEQRHIMPKPLLVPLTGGYRKIPVLQIGADVYCDSLGIILELERRYPEPSVLGRAGLATHMAFSLWADRLLFPAATALIFGEIGHKMPQEFSDDRSRLMGRPFDVEKMRAALPLSRDRLRTQLDWLEQQLGAGRSFLTDDAPGLADFSVYHPLWFLTTFYRPLRSLLEPYGAVRAWMDRVVAIGHGHVESMEPQAALDIAAASVPAQAALLESGAGTEPGQGEQVIVAADDYGRDPVHGRLSSRTAQQIAILREEPLLGAIGVHFPALGFTVKRAAGNA